MSWSPVSPDSYRRIMGAVPTPVTVVTIVDDAGVDWGMTVGAFCSLSLKPPLVLVCIGDDATIADAMRSATHFGVSVLADGQVVLSQRFADTEARTFDGVPHQRAASGVVLLDGAAAHLECRVARRHPGGDHTIVVGEVLNATDAPLAPLLHHRGAYGRLAR